MPTKYVINGSVGGVVPGTPRCRTVDPSLTSEGRLCPPDNTGTPGFSDLPTALNSISMLSRNKES